MRVPQFRRRRKRRGRRRSATLLLLAALFLLVPPSAASAAPLDGLCAPPDPVPEVAGTGLGGLVQPPGEPKKIDTTYENYGMAGQTWHTTDLGCSDLPSMVGNDAANLVFLIAKAIDRVTITVYQTAFSESLLTSLGDAIENFIKQLGQVLYFPYVTPVVLLGVIWLTWQGLVRKRGTMTFEGIIWMVIAVVAATWFLNRPGDIMKASNSVTNGATNAIMAGVNQLSPTTSTGCLPEKSTNPRASSGFRFGTGSDQVANALWSTLVCKPWVAGEFGVAAASGKGIAAELVQKHGRDLLTVQAISRKEVKRINSSADKSATSQRISEQKVQRWKAIRNDIKNNYPTAYPLFQGKQWGTRMGIALAALLAAVFAGALVLLIALTLIVLKVGFLLLMATGPFFLLVGIHPGSGRVIALRWFELLIGTLLKQIVVALALAVLIFGYTVILSLGLPWAIQMLLLFLLGLAAFIYRKPFQHLFTQVGYSTFGQRVLSESGSTNPELQQANQRMALRAFPGLTGTVRRARGLSNVATAAGAGAAGGAAAAGMAARAGSKTQGTETAEPGADAAAVPPAAEAAAGGDSDAPSRAHTSAGMRGGTGSRQRDSAPPLNLPSRRDGAPPAEGGGGQGGGSNSAAAKPSAGGGPSQRSWRESRASGSAGSGGSGDPPLWASPQRRSGETRPPLPFWLHPQESGDDEES